MNAAARKKMRGSLSSKMATFLLVLAIFTGIVFFRSPGASIDDDPEIREYFQIKNGPLEITVSEAGVIKAREKEIIRSEVEGSTTVLWVIEEGREVNKGDLLLELDSSRLQGEIVNQEIAVDNAEAAWVNAREKLDVVKNQAKSDIELAELQHEFAKQDLTKYTEGDYPNSLKELQSNVILKKESLQRSEEKLEWSKKLRGQKFLSGSELNSDELAAQKAGIELDLALENLALLKNYSYKRTIAELESAVHQSLMASKRAIRKAAADIVQAEAELRAKESQFQQEKNKLGKLGMQLKKTRIIAPTNGLVVYATTAKGWMRNRSPLEAGQDIKERQELIYLTKNSTMLAELRVPEVRLHIMEIGLPARVRVDALPGKEFSGRVAAISPLPDAESNWFNSNLKYYTTMIYLDGNARALRTGMSCQVEILVERFAETLYAPIQTVVRRNGHSVVYLEGRERPVEVETGMDNDIMIQIISGVREGDRLLLTPPL